MPISMLTACLGYLGTNSGSLSECWPIYYFRILLWITWCVIWGADQLVVGRFLLETLLFVSQGLG